MKKIVIVIAMHFLGFSLHASSEPKRIKLCEESVGSEEAKAEEPKQIKLLKLSARTEEEKAEDAKQEELLLNNLSQLYARSREANSSLWTRNRGWTERGQANVVKSSHSKKIELLKLSDLTEEAKAEDVKPIGLLRVQLSQLYVRSREANLENYKLWRLNKMRVKGGGFNGRLMNAELRFDRHQISDAEFVAYWVSTMKKVDALESRMKKLSATLRTKKLQQLPHRDRLRDRLEDGLKEKVDKLLAEQKRAMEKVATLQKTMKALE